MQVQTSRFPQRALLPLPAIARRLTRPWIPEFCEPGHALSEHGELLWSFFSRFIDEPRELFEHRLRGATRILLFRDRRGALVGLCALRVVDLRHDGRDVRVLFTHDAIVAPAARGLRVMHWAGLASFLRYGAPQVRKRVYWFADFCSYRGYRVLAHGLPRAWPAAGRRFPDHERGLYLRLCALLCDGTWDPVRGTTVAPASQQREAEVAPADLVARDPHVRFFVEQNPGYIHGDGLPALGHIDTRTLLRALKPPGRRAKRAGVLRDAPVMQPPRP